MKTNILAILLLCSVACGGERDVATAASPSPNPVEVTPAPATTPETNATTVPTPEVTPTAVVATTPEPVASPNVTATPEPTPSPTPTPTPIDSFPKAYLREKTTGCPNTDINGSWSMDPVTLDPNSDAAKVGDLQGIYSRDPNGLVTIEIAPPPAWYPDGICTNTARSWTLTIIVDTFGIPRETFTINWAGVCQGGRYQSEHCSYGD